VSRHVNSVAGRLSLRQPQRDSLEILARVADIINLAEEGQLEPPAALDVIRSEFPSVTDFEREFPSLCFAIATGVGKTRLMGAFIAYLHLARHVRHFFVMAPNLTIYNKLINDFTPGNPKYVFQGIAEFASQPPEVITGDNYESGRGVREERQRQRSFQEFGAPSDTVHVNIFNISKINSEVRGGRAPRIKRLSEYIGESYFEYLAGLDDLVLLMDESHRYRASAGVKAINELKPIIGLELTATPRVISGARSDEFKNVIYSYPLSSAIADGFVKEPAVATRENFDPSGVSPEALERIKLEDGVLIHESTKVELATFSQQNGRPRIKPFMLVVAQDTAHADQVVARFKDDDFFDGRYRDRVITVHSNQRGEEADENVERLLSVENPDEPTEIVVHVDKLKEGWDVTNLYTIVPLRAANSRILVEQSIGRGLRLPYGKRVGIKPVDRLTIVSHDRFQEIIDDANNPNSVIRTGIVIGRDISAEGKRTVTVEPNVVAEVTGQRSEAAAAPASAAQTATGDGTARPAGELATSAAAAAHAQPPLRFTSPVEQQIARATHEAIRKFEGLPRSASLKSPEVQAKLVREVTATIVASAPAQQELEAVAEAPNVEEVVARAVDHFVERSIDIPRIIVVPKGEVASGYRDFELDLGGVRLQPVASDILIVHLRTHDRERLNREGQPKREERLENYLVSALIDYDDVSYDEHADLLYKLAGQVVAHLGSYLPDAEAVENVLLHYRRQLAELIHAQMQAHHWEHAAGYETVVSSGFRTLRPATFTAPANESPRFFRNTVEERQLIRGMLFEGFRRCLYPVQKFDTDTERRFAELLEDTGEVEKWFKPAKGEFQIHYRHRQQDHAYEPDFVVETNSAKLLCEPKRRSDMEDEEVLEKARAAAVWCERATEHELAHGGKPWAYLLIPHDEITANATLARLASVYTVTDTGG
jgi:type III restriction enzyme